MQSYLRQLYTFSLSLIPATWHDIIQCLFFGKCGKHNSVNQPKNVILPLRWRHNGCDSVSNHQPRECLLRRLIRRTSKKRSKLRVTGLCVGNSPGTGEFPAQMASYAENASIWWRHHGQCDANDNGQCVCVCQIQARDSGYRSSVPYGFVVRDICN